MALSAATLFIVSVGGWGFVSADPVVIVDCPVAPGVGPEPASLAPVLHGPACALPIPKMMAAQPARMTCLVFMMVLLGFRPLTGDVFWAAPRGGFMRTIAVGACSKILGLASTSPWNTRFPTEFAFEGVSRMSYSFPCKLLVIATLFSPLPTFAQSGGG